MYDNERPGVAVIIPTTCEKDRELVLRRSINSVLAQNDVDVDVIVVVNGNRVREELYDELCADERLHVVRLEVGSLPAAQRHGRSLVANEYFALLDDDDELLPEALKSRSQVLQKDQSVDAVISNGYFTSDGITDQLHVSNFQFARRDPLQALMVENWLASCGALYRTRTIPLELFDGVTKYYELTLLAIRMLLAEKKLAFLDRPTFRIHGEVSNSLSKSEAYKNSLVHFLQYLLTIQMPRRTRVHIKKKLGKAYHAQAETFRHQGKLRAAWRSHLFSVRYPEGWKYLLYTRKLLIP